jgi:MFS transporter, DHA1 family, multidrug resistance protein
MPSPDSRAIAVLLTALVAFGPLSTDLYLPSLPALVAVFATDAATVQLTLSVFLAGFAVAQLVYGPLSDRFGRRPALLGGIVVYGIGSLGCMLAGSIEQLIAARFVQAVGACCGPVLGRAVVRDVYGRERAATVLAYMAMAMALAPAVGPVLGGYLTVLFGWRANFLVLVAFAVMILAAVWRLLGETNRQPDPEALQPGRLLSNYLTLLGNRRYVGYMLCVAFAYSGIFAFISGSSFVLIGRLGLSPEQYGLSFGVVVLGYMAGTFLTGRLTLRLGIDRMIRAGSVLATAAGLVAVGLPLAGVVTVPAVLTPMFLFMVGAGLILPNAMAGGVGPFATMAGLASALMGFLQMTVAAAVGIAVGHLNDGSPLPMMVAIAVLAIATLLSHRLLVAP